MDQLQQWQALSDQLIPLTLAADARLSSTRYTDDQIWTLQTGSGDAPALALQTRYGGRVGLASIVPMWQVGGRSLYEARDYAQAPVVVDFSPGYARLEARLTDDILFEAIYWVMESQAIGGQFTLKNHGDTVMEISLDLFGHLAASGRSRSLAVLTLTDGTHALSMGRVGDLEPVVVMQNGRAVLTPGERTSPKIGANLTLPPGEPVSVRWAHAGLETMAHSLARAQTWLDQDWAAAFQQIEKLRDTVPVIDAGDETVNAALALSYNQLLQGFVRAPSVLPDSFPVATRHSGRGFSARGDGSDYDRSWSAPTPWLAYLTALAVAPARPDFAESIVRNILAGQKNDGHVDLQTGAAGESRTLLFPPLLARMTWEVYLYTHNDDFLRETFPALMKFFRRWSQSEADTDFDGLPEWPDVRQTGYTYWPTFAAESWGQGAQIRYVETPDMAAYLLSEALSLRAIAAQIGDQMAAASMEDRISAYHQLLDQLWYNSRYAYRDRDTNATAPAVRILADCAGDQIHTPDTPLTPPARLIVRVQGGTSKVPKATLHLTGTDPRGRKIEETAETSEFRWGYGAGVYTSRRVFQQIETVHFTGLSRVYRIHVSSVDYTRLDINALMPLWAGDVPPDYAERMIAILGNTKHFWQPGGITIVSASDDAYDPSSAAGGGGVWMYWVTLMGEGLLANGRAGLAAEAVRRAIQTYFTALIREGHTGEFYHAEEPHSLGEEGHLAGIAPLHLFTRVIGIQILSAGVVWTGGPFAWGATVTVRQHGVTVARSTESIQIAFPSGHTIELGSDAPWQAVEDPNAAPDTPVSAAPADSFTPQITDRVIIDVELDSNPPQ